MAYKKKTSEGEAPKTGDTEFIETEVNEAPVETVAEEVKEESKTKATPKASKKDPEIPANALELLKVFNDYPALYINEKGCVYTSQPPESMGAILYKNPYYKQ